MKKKRKRFDCVQMKRDIQEKLIEESHGLSPAEVREARRRRIEQDEVLGPFVRKVPVVSTAATRES